MAARTLNLVLGLWLFSSGLMFQRSAPSRANAVGVAALVCVFAVASMLRHIRLRFVATALSAWLLVAAFVLPQSPLARWNDAVVAVLMVGLSLVPGSIYPRLPGRGLAGVRA